MENQIENRIKQIEEQLFSSTGIYFGVNYGDAKFLIKELRKSLELVETLVETAREQISAYNDVVNEIVIENLDLLIKLEFTKETLQKIVDESVCRGVDCTYGDTCYAVIARKTLEQIKGVD